MWTVKGKPLRDCTMDELRLEAVAGHALKAQGYVGSFAKLEAVEQEIAFRLISPVQH